MPDSKHKFKVGDIVAYDVSKIKNMRRWDDANGTLGCVEKLLSRRANDAPQPGEWQYKIRWFFPLGDSYEWENTEDESPYEYPESFLRLKYRPSDA